MIVGPQGPLERGTIALHLGFRTFLRDIGDLLSDHRHQPGSGDVQSIWDDAGEPKRHLPGSRWFSNDASCCVDLAI